VKFSPEEMAYEPPEDTSEWPLIGIGPDALFLKLSDARMARLDPDVAVFFRDDKVVNEVLRRAKSLMQMQKKHNLSMQRRKTA